MIFKPSLKKAQKNEIKRQKERQRRRPAICLSLNCSTMDEIRQEIETYKDYCQLVEWCVDKTDGASEYAKEEFLAKLKEIKYLCPGKKIVVDYKGDAETGDRIQRWALGCADIIDIDADNPNLSQLVREAKRKKTKTLISHHNFDEMPERNEIAEQFLRMEKTGGDILKIACFANQEADNYAMLQGAGAYSQLKNHKPIVAIAMGAEGQTSRICAGDFGSVISYACGSKATAPGQFNAKELSGYLDVYYGEK